MERLLDSVRHVESAGDDNAVSPKGAQGPYQFMPVTAAQYGVKNPFDEKESRIGARRYMADLLKQNNNDLNKSLVAWNWGSTNLSKYGIEKAPNESRNFLQRVMTHYDSSPTTPEGNLFDQQPISPLESLFPGDEAIRRSTAGALFPNNRENEALTASVTQPKPVDKAARIYQMQLRTGLPTGLIERNLDEIEQKAKQTDFDAEKFRRQSPLLASWLAQNQARASLAQGDYENLSALEKAWSTLRAIPAGFEEGLKTHRLMELGFKAFTGEITPQEAKERKQVKSELQTSSKEFAEGLPWAVKQGAQFTGLQVPMLLQAAQEGITFGAGPGAAAGALIGAGVGLPGGPPAEAATIPAGAAVGSILGFKTVATASYLAQTYELNVADAYDELESTRDVSGKPIDPTVARYAAAIVGIPNVALEFLSLTKAMKAIPYADKIIGQLTTNKLKEILVRPTVMAAMKDFGKKYAVAVGTESFTEGLQEFLVIVSREIATGDLGKGVTKKDWESVAANASAAFAGTAILGAPTAGVKLIEIHADIQKANRNEAFMRSLGDTVAESKTYANSPKAFSDYVAHLKGDGPIKNVQIPIEKWDMLFQSEAPNAAKEVLGNLKQYTEAKITGGDLVIPLETYAEKLAGTKFHESLLPDIRLQPGEMTPREAAEVDKTLPTLKEYFQKQAEADAKNEAPLREIYDDVYKKAVDSNVTKSEARLLATMTREIISSRAERLNVDPLKLYQEKPLLVQREENAAALEGKLKAYNQQLVEPAVPTPQRLVLTGGKINLPAATETETKTAAEVVRSGKQSEKDYGVFGATIHPSRGNMSGTEGVAVSGYPQRGVITDGAPSEKDITTFLRRNRDIFEADKNAALGIWVDKATGKGYIDITNVLPRDLAIAQGERLGELAVWDLGKGEEIRLPVAKETGQGVLFQRVYHGAQYKFDKFTTEKIGTGEGAQAYGWGLYFADKKAVGEYYRKALAGRRQTKEILVDGQPIEKFFSNLGPNTIFINSAIMHLRSEGSLSRAKLFVDEAYKNLLKFVHRPEDREFYEETAKLLDMLDGKKVEIIEPDKGQLYKVEIPDTDYLLWDKPFSEQSEKVQQAVIDTYGTDLIWVASNGEHTNLSKLDTGERNFTLRLLKKIGGKFETEGVEHSDPLGSYIYNRLAENFGGPKEASLVLNAHGLPGIKYLDQASRGGGSNTYNYVIFNDEAIKILETYYQGEQGAYVPAKNLIALFKTANRSTLFHEMGHMLLEGLRNDALRPDAPDQLKQDWATIKDQYSIEGNDIPTEAHEKFARGFEVYLMEGKSPSIKLRAVFAQLKDWLVRIYKNISVLDAELTPEVRDVMDRLLASDEAIKIAHENSNYGTPLLDKSMMTEEEYGIYSGLNETAKNEAEDFFRAKVMYSVRRENLKVWREEKNKMTKQVRSEILDTPIYRAAYWLLNGALPDGTKLEIPTREFDTKALVNLGVDLNTFAFKHKENGLLPDAAAELLGFENGGTLVRELASIPSIKDAVDSEVTRRMHLEHGDLLTDGTLVEKAKQAVHSTRQVAVFNMEMRILKRLGVGRKLADPAILKDLARDIISRKLVGDLNPEFYEAAALKAGQEAETAMLGHDARKGKGVVIRDLEKAFDAKQKQTLNILLYREAVEQKQAIDKSVRRWSKFLFRSDERLAKTRNMDMVNAARSVAATHGIGGSAATAADYMKALEKYDPQSYDDMKDLVEAVTSDNRHFEAMTVADFNVMSDTIEGLWHSARRSLLAEIDGEKIERAKIIDALDTRIRNLVKPGAKLAGYERSVSSWDKTKMGAIGAKAMIRRVEFWVDAMDDGDPNGVFRRFVWQPISEAADTYRNMRVVMLQKFEEITKAVPKEIFESGKISAPKINYEFADKTELLGALLHTGNESNLQKLLRGRKWGEFTPEGDLDSREWDSFIKRMQDEGVLTKADYDFVQQVWDLFEEMKPDAQKAHKEMYGYYFDEITARPFDTPFGSYRGGYYPAIVDSFIVEDVAIRAEKETIESRPSSFMFPSTGRGFTRSRMEKYAKPLLLDLGLIQQSIEKELRFTYLEPHIKDIGRVVTNKDFRSALSYLDTEVGAVMLVPWLQRTALQLVEMPSGPRMRQFDKVFHELRTRTGLQIMAANVSVALQQLTGLSLAAVKVKPRYLAGALGRLVLHPINFTKQVNESSAFMRNRTSIQTMEIKKSLDGILLNPSRYQKAKEFFNTHGYFMQAYTQHIVDHVTWGGAYEQATRSGADEKSAVRQADSAVRETQGSFAAEDISRFEAGPAHLRLFTMFYNYFNMAANLNATEFIKAQRKGGFEGGGRALYVYTMGFMIPAALADMITQALGGSLFDDDDDDGYLDNFLSSFFGGQVRMGTAMVPIIGPAAQAGINLFNDKWYDDRISLSPAVSTLENVSRTPYDLYRLTTEEDARLKRPVRDIFTLIGLATGLPVLPAAKPVTYLTDIEQGYVEEPENPVELTRGLISGRAPK